jgi:hypothetical protein
MDAESVVIKRSGLPGRLSGSVEESRCDEREILYLEEEIISLYEDQASRRRAVRLRA